MRVLIIGCGYVGLPLGTELVRLGHDVSGLSRHPDEQRLLASGIKPISADITEPEQLRRLPGAYDWLINCVSSSGGGVDNYRKIYLEGTRNLVEWLRRWPPKKFVYTSSTSVYGQNDGSMVSEEERTEPESETAKVLVEAERLLMAAVEQEFPAIVLRVAGIYGPGRGYWFRQYLRSEARIEGAGGRLMNMIHRDDVVGAIIAALERSQPGAIYNAVDDEPVTQLAFFQWLSKQLGRGMPPHVPEGSIAERKRGLTNKQVSNRKLKQELGYQFKYPTFREGYAAEMKNYQ